jgi:DNA-binding transcriptional LysR family regulator
VAKNVGVMLVPVTQQDPRQNHALDLFGHQVRFVSLEGPGCARTIGLCRLKNGYLTPTAVAALDAVREYYESLMPIQGFHMLPVHSINK